MSDEAAASAAIQAQMDADLLVRVEQTYPQQLFGPLLDAAQIVATMNAVEARFDKLEPVAQALLCESVRQLMMAYDVTQSPQNATTFLLAELVELLGLDPDMAQSQVLEALEALAEVQVVLKRRGKPIEADPAGANRDEADYEEADHTENNDASTDVFPELVLQSFTLVWRVSVRHSVPDDDLLVTIVLGEEVVPLIRCANPIIEYDSHLLPQWLRCD